MTLTTNSDESGSVKYRGNDFKLDSGLWIISFHARGDNYGGVLLCCVGYFITSFASDYHNNYKKGILKIDGNVNSFTISLDQGGKNVTYDILISALNQNYNY